MDEELEHGAVRLRGNRADLAQVKFPRQHRLREADVLQEARLTASMPMSTSRAGACGPSSGRGIASVFGGQPQAASGTPLSRAVPRS